MKSWIYLINNFAHDLFTGIWFGSFIGLYVCHAQINELTQPSAAITSFTAKLQGHFFFLGASSLVLVMLTGLVRFLYQKDWEKIKTKILLIKHAFLGTAFIIGSIYAVLWTFFQ